MLWFLHQNKGASSPWCDKEIGTKTKQDQVCVPKLSAQKKKLPRDMRVEMHKKMLPYLLRGMVRFGVQSRRKSHLWILFFFFVSESGRVGCGLWV